MKQPSKRQRAQPDLHWASITSFSLESKYIKVGIHLLTVVKDFTQTVKCVTYKNEIEKLFISLVTRLQFSRIT